MYDILAECMSIYEMYINSSNKKTFKTQLATVAESRKVKIDPTKPLRAIVKVIFNENSGNKRRVNSYCLALEAARSHSIDHKKVADWLEENGGVQEVQRKKKESNGSAAKTEYVAERLAARAKVEKGAVEEIFKMDLVGNKVVLVAEFNDNGSMEIFDVVSSKTAVKAALAALYTNYKENYATSGERADSDKRFDAIERIKQIAA